MARPTQADVAYAQHYGQRFGIPANVLLGLVDVETGGTFRGDLVSKAGARGRTQFMPGTARQYKVKIGDAASEYRGAAQYLRDLGARHDLKHALASYNGGPGNPQYGYAHEVLARAGKYKGASRGAGAALPPSGGTSGTPGQFIPGTPSSGAQTGPGTNVAQLLQAIRPQAVAPQASIPALPQALDARSHLPMPQGYQAPPPSSPAPPKLDVAAQLEAIAGIRGPDVPHAAMPTGIPGVPGTAGAGPAAPHGRLPKGVTTFEGTKVAAWIKPYLVKARQMGWKGTLSSGYRSYADQKRIYDSGTRPAARPGTSNHEGDVFPRGAVDVDRQSAPQLAAILRRLGAPLVWAGAKDPVHFSHPHNGSY